MLVQNSQENESSYILVTELERKVYHGCNLKPLETPAAGFKLLNCNTAEGSFSKEFS